MAQPKEMISSDLSVCVLYGGKFLLKEGTGQWELLFHQPEQILVGIFLQFLFTGMPEAVA